MQDRPDATDLLEAVGDFLKKEVLPAVKDNDLLSYKTLVSWNMLGVLSREIRLGGQNLSEELQELAALLDKQIPETSFDYPANLALVKKWHEELAQQIRKQKISEPQSAQWRFAKDSLKRKLAVSNPRFSLDH